VAIIEIDLRGLGRALRRWHAAGVKAVTRHLAEHPEEFAGLADALQVAAVNETAVRLYKAESRNIFNARSTGCSAPRCSACCTVVERLEGRNDGRRRRSSTNFHGGAALHLSAVVDAAPDGMLDLEQAGGGTRGISPSSSGPRRRSRREGTPHGDPAGDARE